MSIIHDIAFFFGSFGHILEILGAIVAIGGPAAGLSFWLGARWRKRREPEDLRDARRDALKANTDLRDNYHRINRSRRLFESAAADELRAGDILTAAREKRALGVEILNGHAIGGLFANGPEAVPAEGEA